MALDYPVAYEDRAELEQYTYANAALLTHPEVLAEANEYEHRKDYIYWSIGELACHLTKVGEVDAAISLTDRLLDEIEADDDSTLRVWSSIAEKGVWHADAKLRELMGLGQDTYGRTTIPEGLDIHDGYTFQRLLTLYKFGDNTLAPHLRKHIGNIEDEYAQYGVRKAVKIYEAGDEGAYELIKSAAVRARALALEQDPVENDPIADDASDIAQIFKGISSALSPSRSESERKYAQADISLKYFAQGLLEKGDVEHADEVQALMLSKYDTAWLSAQRFALGYDPDGTHLRSAKEYLAVYGDDGGSHSVEIADALVCGGDEAMKAEYEVIYDASLNSENIDTHTAAKFLVALHRSGDLRAHDRLIELLTDPDDSWLLLSSLEKMGFKDEAITIAKKEFVKAPSYSTGLQLLNLQYDSEAMRAVQKGASEYDHDMVGVIHSRSRHLGALAAHIVEIEHPGEPSVVIGF